MGPFAIPVELSEQQEQVLTEAFWSQVERHGAHWLWTGKVTNDGYGYLSLRGTGLRRQVRAHRFAFYLSRGRWPLPLARHLCHIPACVNPLHIAEGTPADNSRDMVEAGRHFNGFGRTRLQMGV